MKAVIDLGGTNIKIAVIQNNVWIRRITMKADHGLGIIKTLNLISDRIRSEVDEDISAFALALPGIVDVRRKILTSTNEKYPDAVGFDFEKWMKKNWNAEVLLENDANSALIGETAVGCARGEENVVMMILGTGIGTAAMMDGHLVRGKHHQAGILGGHFVMDVNGRDCTCGSRGCMETLAGSREIAEYVPLMEGYLNSQLKKNVKIGMKEILEARRNRDPFSEKLFDRITDVYASGIINMVHAYDPEVVVLSGGIMNGKEDILPAISEKVYERVWTPWGKLRFAVAENPDESVLVGLNSMMEGD